MVLFAAATSSMLGCAMLFGLDGLKDRVDGGTGGGGEDGGIVDVDAEPKEASTYAGDAADDSLVGWWRFEDDGPNGGLVNDSSGKANHGTARGSAELGPGKIGNGLILNGTDVEVTVPSSPSLQLTSLTIAAWANLDTIAPTPIGDPRIFFGGWDVKYNVGDGGRPLAEFEVSGNDYVMLEDMTPNTWHHVAFTFDHGTVVGYVDGEKRGVAFRSGFGQNVTLPHSANGFFIGSANGSKFAKGVLDEVRLYSRALPPEVIALLPNLQTAWP